MIVAAVGVFAALQVRSLNEKFDSVANDNVPSMELISRVQAGGDPKPFTHLQTCFNQRTIVAAINMVREEYLRKCNEIIEKNRSANDNTGTYLLARSQWGPVTQRYTVVLDHAYCWARDNAPGAAIRAFSILSKM